MRISNNKPFGPLFWILQVIIVVPTVYLGIGFILPGDPTGKSMGMMILWPFLAFGIIVLFMDGILLVSAGLRKRNTLSKAKLGAYIISGVLLTVVMGWMIANTIVAQINYENVKKTANALIS